MATPCIHFDRRTSASVSTTCMSGTTKVSATDSSSPAQVLARPSERSPAAIVSVDCSTTTTEPPSEVPPQRQSQPEAARPNQQVRFTKPVPAPNLIGRTFWTAQAWRSRERAAARPPSRRRLPDPPPRTGDFRSQATVLRLESPQPASRIGGPLPPPPGVRIVAACSRHGTAGTARMEQVNSVTPTLEFGPMRQSTSEPT